MTRLDGRGVLTTNRYDPLNRLTSSTYSGGSISTPTATFNYHLDSGDPGCFNHGQLADVSATGVSQTDFSCYDPFGRPRNSVQTTSGVSFPFAYTYNLDGSLETQSYPSGATFQMSYDPAGRLTAVSDTGAGVTYAQTPSVVDEAYWPNGAVRQLGLGNGLFETSCLNDRLQTSHLRAGAEPDLGCAPASPGLLQLDFGYGQTDNNGNLLSQTLHAPGLPAPLTQIYLYDAVNRLDSVTEGGWSRTYSYDVAGNRAATGAGIFVNTPQSTNDFDPFTNRLRSAWADYDDAGNLTTFNPVAFEWKAVYDANNKQRFFCSGAPAACDQTTADGGYEYDGQGNRVIKTVSTPTLNETAVYVYDAFGKLAEEHSDQPPEPKAGVLYRTTDHLGSTRLVTDDVLGDAGDPDGDVVERRDFFPFGEEIPANTTFGNRNLVTDGQPGTTYALFDSTSLFRQQFTAKERDDESGLDYFGARYFSASLGRFTGPDAPLVDQFAENPQSWNLYAYVRNNPLIAIDPNGRETRICDLGGDESESCQSVDQSTFDQIRDDKSFIVTSNEIFLRNEDGTQGQLVGTHEFVGEDLSAGAVQILTGLEENAAGSNQMIVAFAGLSTAAGATPTVAPLALEAGSAAAARTATILAGAGESARRLGSRVLTEFTPRGHLFTGSVINQNRFLRIGFSRKGGERVFRVGGQILEKVTGRKKIDIFKAGRL